jgi:guanylate kinase
MFLPFFGASAVGKSTLGGSLLSSPDFVLVPSLTTRPAKPGDLPGEYVNDLKRSSILEMKCLGKLLWYVEALGNMYATPKDFVLEAMAKRMLVHIMFLRIDALKILCDFVGLENVCPVHVHVSDENVLRERMVRRGDTREDVEKRLADIRLWPSFVRNLGLPYRTIDNSGNIAVARTELLGHVSKWKTEHGM